MANSIYRVRGVGGAGVIIDTPPFENPSNAWTDAKNIRFRKSSLEKMGGYLPILTDGFPDEAPLAILQRGNTGTSIFGTPSKLFLIEGNYHRDISALDEMGFPTTYQAQPEVRWYYTNLSNSIVMNNANDNPQGLTPIMDNFEEIPGWGYPRGPDADQVDWKCNIIRAYKNYLIALGMKEDHIELPQRVRWSNVAYVNALPTDWIENDVNKDGGFNDLTDCVGTVVDGLPLRDSFVIYTDQETYLMNFIGGVNVFSFTKLFSDSGILAPECAVEFEGKHFVISQNDIFIHNGSSRQPVASGRVKDFLIEEISSVNAQATKVVALPHMKEIWVCYVGPGASSEVVSGDLTGWACTKAAVWNWEYDTWSFYDIPRSYDINTLLPPSSDVRNWDIYTDENRDEWEAIAQEQSLWENFGKDFTRKVLWVASEDQCLYLLDEGSYIRTWDNSTKTTLSRPLTAYFERTHLDLDDAVEYTRFYKLIKEVIPQIQGYGTLNIRIGGSANPSIAPSWGEVQRFNIEEDTKVDFYANHRYPSIRFEDLGEGDWKMSGYDLIFTANGFR